MKLKKEELVKLYVNMVRTRKFDNALCEGLKNGENLAFYHSIGGEEAVGVGACTFLRKDDYVCTTHRGHGLSQLIGKGGSPAELIAEHAGKATGCCNGFSGWHVLAPEIGMLGMSGLVGGTFPLGVGLGLAAKKRGKGQVVVAFFGDGASNRGDAHEGMNMAAVWKLPIVWVCDNNEIAACVPAKSACPRENIADMAFAYDMPGVVVDGMDVVAVHEAVQAAVERARAGEGPSLVECKCCRYGPHGEGRPDYWHSSIRPKEEVDALKKRDAIDRFREKLLMEGNLTPEEIEAIDKEANEEVEDARRFAADSPRPDPSVFLKSLYAD
ncbi:MAG: thiamine pyrophosphate-dependent dehydrogenase E1 component subunit alpha [Pseudomonadota bacterium]